MATLDPDDGGDDGDVLDQPGALERAAEVLGLPVEDLAAIVEADRRWAAELAAMPDPMRETLAALGPDPLAAELAALGPDPLAEVMAELPPWGPTADDLVAWEREDAKLAAGLAAMLDPPELAEVLDLDPPDDDDRS